MIAPVLPVGGMVGSFHMVASAAILAASMAICAEAMAAESAFADAIAASSSTAASAMSAAMPIAPTTTPPTAMTELATPAALPMAPITAPAEMGGGSGMFLQALQTSRSRAARAPPMNTLEEPVLIRNQAGGMPQQVGARPMSSHLAAGIELMSTRTLTPRSTM